MAKQKKQLKHIAVAGNIGSGKTTLTEKLAKHYNWEARFEDVENNPYLNDFYQDMPRWSFNLQIYFLNSRLRQLGNSGRQPDCYSGQNHLRRCTYFRTQFTRNGFDEYT